MERKPGARTRQKGRARIFQTISPKVSRNPCKCQLSDFHKDDPLSCFSSIAPLSLEFPQTALSPDSRLGPYEILALLDEGGMGQVYKAKDTRLDRIVAVKVLHPHIAEDTSARARFEREARTVSALDHPHIGTLFDLGEQDEVTFLVMEFLEGETLANRLKKGALPLEEALLVAAQLADGLDAGHRAGVVHRDFKPGNIMLTARGAKIMDYGLAKLRSSAAQPGEDLSALPTEDKPLTKEGAILGTLQYMAPEQLEAKNTDARTDIFAYGAVVYEMLTGRRTFEGKSQASLISAIMKDEPPVLSTLKPMLPSALDHVVKACLAKEPDQRWQSAGDVGRQLNWIAEGGTETGIATPARSIRRHLAWGFALVLAAIVAGVVAWNLKPPAPRPPRPVTRFQLLLPPGDQFTNTDRHVVALSSDGTHLVYATNQQLYLRAMDQMEATPIGGTEGGARNPFFSPDGQWVGFWADGHLRKVSVSGGAAVTLCEASNPYGASWGPMTRLSLDNIQKASCRYPLPAVQRRSSSL